MVRSLLWKEWREHRWKMLGILAVYLGIASMSRLLGRDGLQLILERGLFAMGIVVPGFLAVGTVCDERSGRTLDTLKTLPVSLKQTFLIKWCAGLVTALIPLLISYALIYLILYDPADVHRPFEFAWWLGFSVFLTVGVYSWTVALAVGARSEFRAAIIAIAVLVAGGIGCRFDLRNLDHHAYHVVWGAVGPLGAMVLRDSNWPDLRLLGGLHIITASVLLAWATARYGRVRRATRGTVGRVRATKAIEAAHRFPVVWKTWREIGPSLGWFLGICIAALLIDGIAFSYSDSRLLQQFGFGEAENIVVYLVLAALGLAVVVGVEIGIGDFERKVDRFWLARPIEPGAYFIKRFLIAWAALQLVVILPIVAVEWVDYLYVFPNDPFHKTWLHNYITRENWQIPQVLGFLLPAMSTSFAMAVFFAGVFRSRIASMVLACGAIVVQYVALGLLMEFLKVGAAQEARGYSIYVPLQLFLSLDLFVLGLTSAVHNWKERLDETFGGRRPRARLAS